MPNVQEYIHQHAEQPMEWDVICGPLIFDTARKIFNTYIVAEEDRGSLDVVLDVLRKPKNKDLSDADRESLIERAEERKHYVSCLEWAWHVSQGIERTLSELKLRQVLDQLQQALLKPQQKNPYREVPPSINSNLQKAIEDRIASLQHNHEENEQPLPSQSELIYPSPSEEEELLERSTVSDLSIVTHTPHLDVNKYDDKNNIRSDQSTTSRETSPISDATHTTSETTASPSTIKSSSTNLTESDDYQPASSDKVLQQTTYRWKVSLGQKKSMESASPSVGKKSTGFSELKKSVSGLKDASTETKVTHKTSSNPKFK